MMVMNAAVQVRSAVWVREMQLDGRTDGRMGRNAAVRVRSTVSVGEM